MIPNKAITHTPIIEPLAERWSPRAFTSQPVEGEKIQSLLEAFRWAPSSMNEQPWYIVMATKDDPTNFDKLLACLVDANQVWAKNAPLLMITFYKTTFNRNSTPNRVALHDTGMALMALSTQATAMGLQAHGMGGIHLDKIKQDYSLPADVEPVAGVAIGYPGEADQLAEPLRSREVALRTRKSLNDFVFEGTWGNSTKLL